MSAGARGLRARLVPDSFGARLAWGLAAALVLSHVAALMLLSLERDRMGRAAGISREAERIVALVPAMETVSPELRTRLARRSSTPLARIRVAPEPLLPRSGPGSHARALAQQMTELLAPREVRAGQAEARAAGRRGGAGATMISVALDVPGPPAWLNVIGPPEPASPGGGVLVPIFALSMAAVLASALLFVKQMTRPLRRLANAAQAAGRGERGVRLPETGAREMREAAIAFNEMQARIARFEEDRMRSLAAVGHDLRTPITSLRIRAEMLPEEEGIPMIATLAEMEVMAASLVSAAAAGKEGEARISVDLSALLVRLCEERGVAFSPPPGAPAAWEARAMPVALSRALGNLLDNAVRYGRAPRAHLARQGAMFEVAIEDEGPGLPEARIEAMFEPFVRGEESRNALTGGSGLGLAIARGILRAHGGDVRLENRSEGGLRARARIPRAGPDGGQAART